MDRYDHIWGVFITGGGKRCRMDLMFIPPEYWTYALVGEWVWEGVMGWVGEWVGGRVGQGVQWCVYGMVPWSVSVDYIQSVRGCIISFHIRSTAASTDLNSILQDPTQPAQPDLHSLLLWDRVDRVQAVAALPAPARRQLWHVPQQPLPVQAGEGSGAQPQPAAGALSPAAARAVGQSGWAAGVAASW